MTATEIKPSASEEPPEVPTLDSIRLAWTNSAPNRSTRPQLRGQLLPVKAELSYYFDNLSLEILSLMDNLARRPNRPEAEIKTLAERIQYITNICVLIK